MNDQIAKLYQIGLQQKRLILGTMSGTSLDGLDIALCEITDSGLSTQLQVKNFISIEYDEEFRNNIRKVFAKKTIDQAELCGLNPYVALVHSNFINKALRSWGIANEEVDLIASHGQTVYHAPQSLTQNDKLPNSTLQIGDGDHLAVQTGIITISDFRQKHVAAGGEGAPLAAYGDYLLFTDSGESRLLLNIGGISNFTFLPAKNAVQNTFASDLGPGNTIMNQYMLQHFAKEMDKDAEVAKKGKIHEDLLNSLLNHDFFTLDFPKTTGPEMFNLQYLADKQKETKTSSLSREDVMATLNAFTAKAIVNGIIQVKENHDNLAVYISGGGIHNHLLVQNIRNGLARYKVTSIEDLLINADAKEACLFAILANETVAGTPTSFNNLNGGPAVCMGKISLPR